MDSLFIILWEMFFLYRFSVRERFLVLKNLLFSILVVCNSKKCFSLNINLFENIENYFRKDKKNWFRVDNVENWYCYNVIGWFL